MCLEVASSVDKVLEKKTPVVAFVCSVISRGGKAIVSGAILIILMEILLQLAGRRTENRLSLERCDQPGVHHPP